MLRLRWRQHVYWAAETGRLREGQQRKFDSRNLTKVIIIVPLVEVTFDTKMRGV